MPLPSWLDLLRRTEVIEVVRRDRRTHGEDLLGFPRNRIFNDALGGGQADFDAPCESLTGDDRALLYAWFNQLGHIEELRKAFDLLFGNTLKFDNPVVLDLGCGPFTGGLALASILGPSRKFLYIGVDRALSMCRLGQRLAESAMRNGGMDPSTRCLWFQDMESIQIDITPGWAPVLVIVSYLLASPSLDVRTLTNQLCELLDRIGRGPVTVLYTNAIGSSANRNFPDFRDALEEQGFALWADDNGLIDVVRQGIVRPRQIRYALFQRPARTVLPVE